MEPKKSEPDGSRFALAQLTGVIERVVSEGTVVAWSDGSSHEVFPVALAPAEGEALRGWVMREQPTRTIEIGLGYGVAALYLCEGLVRNGDEEARHVVLDPNQRTRFGDVGLQLLDEAGVRGLVEFHPQASEFVLPRFLEAGRRFDLAVVDANHRFDGVFLDLWYLGRLLRPGGIVFLDDYQLPAVARADSFFLANLGWRLEELSPPDDLHQWAVLRTSDGPDRRSFDHFVDF